MKTFIVFAAIVASACGASLLDSRDALGNFYDGTTGQISDATTGRVYNTRLPLVSGLVGSPLISTIGLRSPLVLQPASLVYGQAVQSSVQVIPNAITTCVGLVLVLIFRPFFNSFPNLKYSNSIPRATSPSPSPLSPDSTVFRN